MDSAQDKYRSVLVEIKRRTSVVKAFMSGSTHAVYLQTTVESNCLQIRKILELIAFSSLIANKELYSQQHKKFSEHWNARLVLQDLERINKDFYPSPIIQKPSTLPGVTRELLNSSDDFLTKEKLIKIYELCGGILHADNPYGSQTNYERYQADIKDWMTLIINLLNAHTIRLVNDKNIYLFQMGSETGNPSYTPFSLVEK